MVPWHLVERREIALKSVEIEIRNESGLHARPAAVLVRAASAFRSRIGLDNLTTPAGPTADAKSLVSVLAAGVEKGHRVRIWAEGEDEAEAVDALRELLGDELGESRADAGAPTIALGVPAAPGIAVGPIWRPDVEGMAGVPGAAEAGGPGAVRTAGAAQGAADPEARIRAAATAAAAALDALAARLRELDRTGRVRDPRGPGTDGGRSGAA